MLNLNLLLAKLSEFLPPTDRVALACTCRRAHYLLQSTLSPQFDHKLTYLSFISTFRRKITKKTKRVERQGRPYTQHEFFINQLPEKLTNLTYSIADERPHETVLINEFQDLLIVHPAWVHDEPVDDEVDYEILANAEELNANIDFHNPAMLVKRQANLLAKLNAHRHQKVAEGQAELMRYIRSRGEIAVILCHGGNFCIAVYGVNGKCLTHQSDHRYVTRKKQGGRQMAKDKNAGRSIHSMGASIRRNNEKKHQEAIEAMVTEHMDFLQRASIIFLYAPGLNKYFFLGREGLLSDFSHKIKSVGLSVGKANFTETERVFKEVTQVTFLLQS